ncbi:MAG: hypothetical protein ACLQQ4_02515 [Bacteroidia bacterium]
MKQVGQALGGKCNRTATRYCIDNGIKIYPKPTGRGRWVYAAEYYQVRHADLIPDLVKEYGDGATDALEAYLANDPIKLMMLKKVGSITIQNRKKYIPQGKMEQEFLSKFRNIKP